MELLSKQIEQLNNGLQPFLTNKEELLYVNLGTNKATVLSGLLVGQVVGGGVIGELVTDSITSQRKKTFILGLTNKRLILVEILKRSPFSGVIEKTGDPITINLKDIVSIDLRPGLLEASLELNTNDKSVTVFFEYFWTKRAKEMSNIMLTNGIISKTKKILATATGKINWFAVLISASGWTLGAIVTAYLEAGLLGIIIWGFLGGIGIGIALKHAGISISNENILGFGLAWIIGLIPIVGWVTIGWITGRMISKNEPSFGITDTIVIALGWFTSWIFGYATLSLLNLGNSIYIDIPILGLIIGLTGSSIMFWQLSKKR